MLSKASLATAFKVEHEPPVSAMFQHVGLVGSLTVKGNQIEITRQQQRPKPAHGQQNVLHIPTLPDWVATKVALGEALVQVPDYARCVHTRAGQQVSAFVRAAIAAAARHGDGTRPLSLPAR